MEIVNAKRDVDTELRLGMPGRGGASAAAAAKAECKHVKVSMQGIPYQRQVDLRAYRGHGELRAALAALFCSAGNFTVGFVDEEDDLVRADDLPWDMFVSKCKKLWCL